MRDNDKIAIEEMAKVMCGYYGTEKCYDCRYCCDCHIKQEANRLCNAGYRKQSGWISVEERLPDNDWGKHWKERKYYLVFTKPSGLMNVAVYGYKEHDWWIDRNSCVLDKKNYNEVTHWMPLPEPPKDL